MASVYPSAYDNLNDTTNPTLTHRNVTEAIEAIQQNVGLAPWTPWTPNLSRSNPAGWKWFVERYCLQKDWQVSNL